MRQLIAFLLLVMTSFGFSQEMMEPLPKEELKAIDFLVGNFKLDLTFSFGGQETKGGGTVKTEMSLNGRYQKAMHNYTMAPGAPAMEGMQMLTYDPGKKTYVSHWFDGTAPGAIPMAGKYENGILQLTGEGDMMGSKVRMRATYTKRGSGFGFLLEMEQEGKWMKLMEGKATKS